jgi:hypothetical protein
MGRGEAAGGRRCSPPKEAATCWPPAPSAQYSAPSACGALALPAAPPQHRPGRQQRRAPAAAPAPPTHTPGRQPPPAAAPCPRRHCSETCRRGARVGLPPALPPPRTPPCRPLPVAHQACPAAARSPRRARPLACGWWWAARPSRALRARSAPRPGARAGCWRWRTPTPRACAAARARLAAPWAAGCLAEAWGGRAGLVAGLAGWRRGGGGEPQGGVPGHIACRQWRLLMLACQRQRCAAASAQHADPGSCSARPLTRRGRAAPRRTSLWPPGACTAG